MGAHFKWEDMRPLKDPRAREIQMAYVDGYILALEDVLSYFRKTVAAADNEDFFSAMIPIRQTVRETLKQAQRTMKVLEGKDVRPSDSGVDGGSGPGTADAGHVRGSGASGGVSPEDG